MKQIILLLSILISSVAIAQKQVEKKLGDFKEVKVYDLMEVELVESKENKAILLGDYVNDVVINNKNGVLKIKMSLGKSFDGNKNKVILHYTNLNIVDANEGAIIIGKNPIKQFEIDLKTQEGGRIQIPLDVTYANIKAVTGGIITTSGTSKSQKVSLLTGGVYEGESLQTERTEVSVNAGGKASIKASKQVDAKVRAGGEILIYGNPETVNQETVLGGNIQIVE